MTHALGTVNRATTRAFDGLFALGMTWPPVSLLLAVSALVGVVAALVFHVSSNQSALARVSARMSGNLLAVWFYRHDTRTVLSLQRAIVGDAVRRILLAVPPLLILVVPLGLVMGQLHLRFAARPLPVDRPALVIVQWPKPPRWADLVATDGLQIEARVRLDSEGETVWRIRGRTTGLQRVIVRTDRGAVDKAVSVGDGSGAISQVRTARLLDAWLQPGEEPIPRASGIASITVGYPARRLSLFGVGVSWAVVFAAGTLGGGLLAARVLGTAY
jgi:hypothetical protein